MLSAKITTDVRFVGLDHTIELWNREMLEKTALSPATFKDSVKKYLGSK